MGNANNTLTKNAIKQFILRVDFTKSDALNIGEIAERMSVHFDRSEKRQISGFQMKLTQGVASEVVPQNAFDFVLISEQTTTTLTFSEVQNAFWIECNNYINNSIYKEIIDRIIEVINIVSPDIESKRIGLRYINEFKCNNLKSIGKIYAKRLTNITKKMLDRPKLSRIIGMEEYNNDGYKLRLQYGIPNKFYPSVINVFDLLMDIDSYIDSTNTIGEWEGIIVNLNHAAYSLFIDEINTSYLEELK
jgi:uncharacterized protein (TIGR04255 family)